MKLLLIDDNRSLTTLLSRALKKLGYDPSAENNALNAVSAVKNLKPDLIILDLDMPYKSGLEIYGELKLDSRTAKIPVIMLASLSMPGAVRAEVFGCDVISKPAKLEDLHDIIERNLSSKSSRTELVPTPSNQQKREVYENILQ